MSAAERWADALTAAQLFARDPAGFGGVVLRARAGPLRDRWLAYLRALMPGTPLRKIPANVDADRLSGGLDLAATLAAGRPVLARGLLAECTGGVALAAMAERMPESTAALIAAALDERALGVVLLDEGVDEQRPPAALADRCAFLVDLSELGLADAAFAPADDDAGADLSDDAAIRALCALAGTLGVSSARAPIFALRGARELAGGAIREAALARAARLVLAPRATRLPDATTETPEPAREPGKASDADQSATALDDMLIEAIAAALPPGVLAALAARRERGRGAGAGATRRTPRRGRPAGARRGMPGSGARLAVIDTLRAAAPWQPIRRAETGRAGLIVRRDDLHVRRFVERAESTTIFVVDASGSAAAERLAEAKGAVELLLAEAYVRRTEVALVAFRGAAAELLLPPTRSLTRAKRCLAEMAGGGGTPLAAGLNAGHALAAAARGKGRTPFLVLMTDGRANVALDGAGGRESAEAEALRAAKLVRADCVGAALIDISARPRGEGARLAEALGARYVALPRLEAGAIRAAAAG